jgi:hypothetical protein
MLSGDAHAPDAFHRYAFHMFRQLHVLDYFDFWMKMEDDARWANKFPGDITHHLISKRRIFFHAGALPNDSCSFMQSPAEQHARPIFLWRAVNIFHRPAPVVERLHKHIPRSFPAIRTSKATTLFASDIRVCFGARSPEGAQYGLHRGVARWACEGCAAVSGHGEQHLPAAARPHCPKQALVPKRLLCALSDWLSAPQHIAYTYDLAQSP